jgi:uncharacterized oxidoreductase
MRLTGNTVLVTGGGSGIGRGLAIALHRYGNRVVIAGRRIDALRTVADAHPGIEWLPLDITSRESIHHLVAQVQRDLPDLNVVVNNAAAMAIEDVCAPDATTTATVIATNLAGPVELTSLLLGTIRSHAHGAVVNVTSALAFVPLATAPTYSATKAALHAYTVALRFQLRGSGIQVTEIVPPRVQTNMAGPTGGGGVLDVDDFVAQVMTRWVAQPDAAEIIVAAAGPLRYAERDGAYEQRFAMVNGAIHTSTESEKN